jgi:ubiquitin C-terminal hydrolase
MTMHIRAWFAAALLLRDDDFASLVNGSLQRVPFGQSTIKPNLQHDNFCYVPSSAPSTLAPSKASTEYSEYNIVGLQNLGHICYLNAQVQCAYHIPFIRYLILNDPSNDVTSTSQIEPTPSPAYIGMRQLFFHMNESKYGRAVAPTTLCQLLDIPLYEQQDSQEFWKLLLPALQVPKIMDLYTGTYENYIVALDGSNRERRFLETFLDLSLDVVPTRSDSNSISIMEALQQQFNQPELLSEATGNGWRPSSKDPEKIDAHKGYRLLQDGLPSILQIHLKRFHFDWNTETTNKLNHGVTFPITLDLSSIVSSSENDSEAHGKSDDERIYELQSVIVHVGEYESGHYYAYVRPDIHTDDWYRFNDEIHSKVSFTDVIRDAYGGNVGNDNNADNIKTNRIVRFFRGIFGIDNDNIQRYGFGGPKSSAYVLQYIRRKDIGKLYDSVTHSNIDY